jgi:hypothetical protein
MIANVKSLTIIDAPDADSAHEALLSRLTDAAYRVVLRHGIKGSFIDVQLDLWHQLRAVLSAATEEGNAWQR